MILRLVLFSIYLILRAYQGIMGISILISWFPGIRMSKFGIIIDKTSDWYLGYFRGYIVLGSIDFTPMLGIILYEYIINLLLIY